MKKLKNKDGKPDARFAYEGLDRVIHEKARLGVLTSLVAHPKGLAFADLKILCGLTDGNLSRHLHVLEEAGLIEIAKRFQHNRPLRQSAGSPAPDARVISNTSPCSNRWCATPPKAAKPDPIRAERVFAGLKPHKFFYQGTLQCKVL